MLVKGLQLAWMLKVAGLKACCLDPRSNYA